MRGREYKLWRNERAGTIHFTAKKRDSNDTDSRDRPDGGIGYFSVMANVTWKCVCGLSWHAGKRAYRERYDNNQRRTHSLYLCSRLLLSSVKQPCLKAVFGFRRKGLHQEYVGLSQPFKRRLQWRVFHFGNGANELVGEAAPNYGGDLCHLTRWSEPVQPRSQ